MLCMKLEELGPMWGEAQAKACQVKVAALCSSRDKELEWVSKWVMAKVAYPSELATYFKVCWLPY